MNERCSSKQRESGQVPRPDLQSDNLQIPISLGAGGLPARRRPHPELVRLGGDVFTEPQLDWLVRA